MRQKSQVHGILLLATAGFVGCMPTGGRREFMPPVDPQPTYVNPAVPVQLEGFSGAVKVGLTLYIAGQVALDSSGHLVGPGDLTAQMRQAFANLAALVRAARGVPGDVVKLTVYVVNYTPEAFQAIKLVSGEFFPPRYTPALTLVGVSTLPEPGTLVSVDGIAVLRGEYPDRSRDQPSH